MGMLVDMKIKLLNTEHVKSLIANLKHVITIILKLHNTAEWLMTLYR